MKKIPKIIEYIPSNIGTLPLATQLKLIDKQLANFLRVGKYIKKSGCKEEKQEFLKTLTETQLAKKNILNKMAKILTSFSYN